MTKIEWADETWNPVLGCDKVSPGCDVCFAIIQACMRAANPNEKIAGAFAGLTKRTDHGTDWTGQVNLLPERLTQPLAVRKPQKWFVNSLADLFHDAVPDEFIARVFAVMAACPQHTFLILTKRQGRMRSLLEGARFNGFLDKMMVAYMQEFGARGGVEWPLQNVWLGVSAEDQHWAEIRIPSLLATPAAVHWLSYEPALGPVNLRNLQARNGALIDALYGDVKTPAGEIYAACPSALSWVVAGGESGPKARPMHPAWARNIRDQVTTAGVPFFFKQWGQFSPYVPVTETGTDWDCSHMWVDRATGQTVADEADVPDIGSWQAAYRVGKTRAGRDLDGQIWDEYPVSA